MAGSPAPIETFRDPAGSLWIEGHLVKRRVKPEMAKAALRFLRSPLAQEWVAAGRLIPTTESPSSESSSESGEILLGHPRVFFPSYPWEWTPDAWVAAAELTLDLCDALLGEGLILKDATPLNVLFEGTRPVFVDVLSIDERDPESPLWLAYAQFVRTFLLPLAAFRYLGWPLAASLQKRDGYEPGNLYPHLSRIQRWREPLRSLVTLPFLLEKQSKPTAAATRLRQSPEVATAVLRRNLHRLRIQLRKLKPTGRDSRWSGYPDSADHYTDEDHKQKHAFVHEALVRTQPHQVLDMGANTGVYSRIAVSIGANVVAWDTDLGASERNWKLAEEKRLPIQPLIADPARPTPAVGWRNREWMGLLERAQGRFDCVMMLGLIHHLLVTDQIPLGEIAALLRDLTTRWSIVEWVPATDPRFGELVRGREELYRHLNEAGFVTAVEKHFSITTQERLKNGRCLFLLEAK